MGYADTHRTVHEVFNGRDFDAMDPYLDQSLTYEDQARGLTLKGAAEFKDWLRGWTSAFSDARPDDGQYLEGPDFSVSLFRGRGINDGSFGPFPATNKEMDLPYCEILRYGPDGKVVWGGIYYDQVTLLSQLGHIQPPG